MAVYWSEGLPYDLQTDSPSGVFWSEGQPFYTVSGATSITGSAGIASVGAFGLGGTVGAQVLTGVTGIASAGAFGAGGLVYVPITLTGVTGIPPPALASPLVVGIVAGPILGVTGIPPPALASPLVVGIVAGPIVGVAGIASVEGFGADGQLYGHTLTGVTGIASSGAFGADGTLGSIGGPLTGVIGIPSAEVLGVGIVAGPITGVTGIPPPALASPLVVGSLETRIIGAAGIPSALNFPSTGKLYWGIGGLLGIPTAEAFGGSGILLTLDTAQPFAISIGGTWVTSYLRADSLSVDRQLNFAAAAALDLVDPHFDIAPMVGKEIIAYYYDTFSTAWYRIFAGSVETFEVAKFHVLNTERIITIRAVDYSKTLSRRVINMRFNKAEYGTLGAIMEWIQSNILTGEGITYTLQGEAATVVEDVEFSCIPLNEALDKLAETVGGSWSTDFWKNLYIDAKPTSEALAPIEITEDTTGPNSGKWLNLRVNTSRGLYRNKQYIKATFSSTGESTSEIPSHTVTVLYTCPIDEPMPPNVVARFWQVDGNGKAPFLADHTFNGMIKRVVEIKLNGAVVEWFTQQLAGGGTEVPPANWKWMQIYERDAQFIFNMMADPTMATWPVAGDTLEITYEIYNEVPPPPATVEDGAEIVYVQGVEGGTGVWEAVEELTGVYSQAFIENYAQQLLDKFGVWGQEIDFDMYYYGLEPGMGVYTYLPHYGVNPRQLMTVESIAYRELQRTVLQSSVKVSNQVQQRDALTAFQRLVKRIRKAAKQVVGVVTWDLSVTYPGVTNPGLMVGTSLGNTYVLRFDVNLDNVAVYFKTPPTGASIKIDIKANGVSIFDSVLEYPVGATTTQVFTSFKSGYQKLVTGTLLTLDVTQVGSIQPGKDGTVHLAGWQ